MIRVSSLLNIDHLTGSLVIGLAQIVMTIILLVELHVEIVVKIVKVKK